MPNALTIRRPHPIDLPVVEVEIVIVGAGFGGLGMGIQLLRQGITSFVILERADDVGGTWRDNVYPGVACDVPSHLYSYSFRPKLDWSHFYARGAEIHDYLRECVQEEGLRPHLRMRAEALEMNWDDSSLRWQVRTPQAIYRCEMLVVSAGRLSEPRIPDIQGLESFPGPIFHSSRWDEHAELAGKCIGVVGTGASAVQLVPHLAAVAEGLVLFQRSAPYVVPRSNRSYSEAEKRTFLRLPDSAARLRSRLFWKAEAGFAARAESPEHIGRLRAQAVEHLERQIADPVLRAQLAPDYSIGCKRVLLSDDFYPSLSSPGVVLEPSPLERINGRTAIAANGAEHDIDVLVLATGFQATTPPFAERIMGSAGLRLSERWKNGMVSYASTSVSGFPNMFIINGPNASLGHNSAIFMIEVQVRYILKAIEYLHSTPYRMLDVDRDAEVKYVLELDHVGAATVWTQGGCDSWYIDPGSRRLTLIWPDFAYEFQNRLSQFTPADYRFRSFGDADNSAHHDGPLHIYRTEVQ
ncbi:flavin-containing monooxygenase [Arthrobacter wenxiniae]|uniref:NAD(P)/FAD-dependent oxidoreductase n=1 Tax=Arthrobacter wenxiniae TaxID=2713570 RepID=A0A7Y7IG83_9MICC|nr:NAD(P)/FAD-dependent oxidoreductase [Arthrobacter wenxiniae]NVM94321.1 NAD(P)/FAD-dependent oxidoreductase [Arthrobacter wenxiniae]